MQQPAAPINSPQPMVTPSEGLAVVGLQKPSSDAVSRILALQEKFGQQQGSTAPVPQEVKQLPLWPDEVRGVPNALLRSSLFSVSKERDVFIKLQLLASTAGTEIRFKGERFNQTDLGVWEMLLHLTRLQPLGSQVRFTAYSMLKALDRGTGKTQREQLKDEIARLASGLVEVTWGKEEKEFGGVLVSKYFRDKATQEYVIVLNEELLALYEYGYSYINWEQRKTLKSSLAQWLHAIYSGHAEPFPYKVETIRSLCGSSTKQLRDFRRMLKAALIELVDVGAIKSWEITTTDLVRVVAVPSESQVKHIKKKRGTRSRKPSTFSQIGNHHAARGKIT